MIEEAARKADVLDAAAPTTHQLLLSQAISLRRIADALDPPPLALTQEQMHDLARGRYVRVATTAPTPTIPEGPIYWSAEEMRRLFDASDKAKPHYRIPAVADETIAIMRDRASQQE